MENHKEYFLKIQLDDYFNFLNFIKSIYFEVNCNDFLGSFFRKFGKKKQK